jgi:hypothetical protein
VSRVTLCLSHVPADVENGYPDHYTVTYDGQPAMANTAEPARAVAMLARQVADLQRRRSPYVIQVWDGATVRVVADCDAAAVALAYPVTR